MKLNSSISMENSNVELINPVYEKKAISVLTKVIIRFLDIVGALVGIFLLIPVTIYVFLQKIVSKENGPLFYSQKRIGKNGKLFKLYKLNTKPTLSEFPQFINVLIGQMTLVGPRPYTTEEIEKMGEYYNWIIRVKPGITGVYQISGKKRITFDDRLNLDLQYLLNASLKLNVKILLITIFITSRKDRTDIYEKEVYSSIPVQNVITESISKRITIVLKRAFDIVGSLIGIIVLIPITVFVWLFNLIAKENGPLFYTQARIGKDGKMFKMYKFRSMIVNAEDRLKAMLESNEEIKKEFEETRKLKNDPRITKIGKFLRKTSLDEFPQFINVLKGEMSLVGPRAVIEDEIEMFGDKKEKFLSVKPGITGYWAANGRSNTTYEERVEMEVYYAENLSLWLDIKILFKTVLSVLKAEGAV